jgi:hypothetical protein
MRFAPVDAGTVYVLGSDATLWLQHGPFGTVPPKREQVDANVFTLTSPTYPGLHDVREFGALGNARYFNGYDGRWYQDSELTVEASDDAPGFRAAMTFVGAIGGGSIYIPSGNWYFKTVGGPQNEFVLPQSNVTVFGDGDTSAIRIAPGLNTVGFGGYGAVFGFSPGTATPTDNVRFRNFLVDCNSAFNQFPPNPDPKTQFGGVRIPWNAAIAIPAGNNVVVDSVSVINHNGVFAVAVGTSGRPDTTTNYRVSNCRAYHLADDPNLFDRSWFLVAGTHGVVVGNRIDWGGVNNRASYPLGCAGGTGIEIHGAATVLANNVIVGGATGINVGAESFDMADCMIVDNIIQQAASGINLVCAQGFMAQRVEIARNLMTIIEESRDLPGSQETGISLGSAGLAFGVGVFDLRVHNNSIIFTGASSHELAAGIRLGSLFLAPDAQTGGANTGELTTTIAERVGGTHYSPITTPPLNMYSHQDPQDHRHYRYCCFNACTTASTPPATFPTTTGATLKDGVNDDPSKDIADNFLCSGPMTDGTSLTTGGGWDVHHNKIRGFRFRGVYLGVANLMAGGNVCGDVHIHDNLLYNTGIYGIDVEGYAQATSPEFVGLEILNNQIVDDRAAGSQLQWGVYVNAYTDKTTIVWGNRVIGYADADVNFGISPPAQHYWPNLQANVVICEVDALANNSEVAALQLENTTPATAATTNQYPPGTKFVGSFWNGSASEDAEGMLEFFAASNPAMAMATRLGGSGPWIYPFSATWFPGPPPRTAWTCAGEMVLDKSQSGGAIRELYGPSQGSWSVQSAATNNTVARATDAAGGNTQWQFESTTQIGFFGANPVGKQPGGGALTAGGAYAATEQSMLNFCYSALRAYGLI